MRRSIAFLLVFAVGCPACFAGNGPDQKHVEKIKNQVNEYLEKGRMVSVETYDHHKMWGAIHEAGPDAFVLTVARTPTSIPYTNVKKIKASMDPGVGNWTSVQNLPVRSAISVKTKTGDKYNGELVNVTPESLTIDSDERAFPGRVITRRDLRREDIREVRFQAQVASVLAGAAIGAGVGGGIAAGVEATGKSNEDRGLAIGVLASLGAAIGSAIASHYPIVKGKLVYVVR